jgi:Flp pilus assembly protein TadG
MTRPLQRARAALARHGHGCGEEGQILVLTLIMMLGLLAVLGLVADGGLVFARHRELQAAADAAARAGAAQLDETIYRASNGRTAQLDPTRARQAARRYLQATRFAGEVQVSADAGSVTVSLHQAMRPPIFGALSAGDVQLVVRSLARPRTGITQPQPQAQGP